MKKAYISVFFALIFMVLAAFVLSIFQGIRVNAARLKAECAFSISQNALLSEYNRDLLEEFDLLYIDTSFGQKIPDYHQIEAHLWNYLEKNTTGKLLSVELLQITMASDDQGISYRKQISDYMEDKLGISYAEQLKQLFETASKEGFLQENFETESAFEKKRQKLLSQTEQIPDETWEKVEKLYSAEKIGGTSHSFVLSQVIPDEESVSVKMVNSQALLSNRSLLEGNGMEEQLVWLDKICFLGYVFEKFSYYGEEEKKEEEEKSLDYEVEYLFGGCDSDYDNLSKVAKALLVIRETANLSYLLTDSEKMAAVEELSAALSTLIACPELSPVFEVIFVGLWSYAESITDVKMLFEGKEVPLLKSAETWNTDLDGQVCQSESEGLSYKQYLEMLLLFSNEEKITYRSMDLIELKLRNMEGNENFRMDGCADNFAVSIIFSLPSFGSYQIVRKFGFDF